jgi:hypothetical protein
MQNTMRQKKCVKRWMVPHTPALGCEGNDNQQANPSPSSSADENSRWFYFHLVHTNWFRSFYVLSTGRPDCMHRNMRDGVEEKWDNGEANLRSMRKVPGRTSVDIKRRVCSVSVVW